MSKETLLPEGYGKKDVALRTVDKTTKRTKLVMKDNAMFFLEADGTWTRANPSPVDRAIDNAARVEQEGADNATTQSNVGAGTALKASDVVDQGTGQAKGQVVDTTTKNEKNPSQSQTQVDALLASKSKELDEAKARITQLEGENAANREHIGRLEQLHRKPSAVPSRVGHVPARVEDLPTVDELNANNGQPESSPK